MKEQLNFIKIREKQTFVKDGVTLVTALSLWDDNTISDTFMDDTLGIGVETFRLTKKGKIKPYDEPLRAVWLTKNQAIILKNHLDLFIQFAQTKDEIK